MLIEKEMGFVYFKENKIPRCCNKYLLEKRKQNVIHNMITAQYTLDVRSGNLRSNLSWGTSINDVPRFLAIFKPPTYLVLLYNVPFWGLSWTPPP